MARVSCSAILAAALALLLVLAGSAQAAPPALPYSPYGIVTLDGATVPDGTMIAAYCGGNVVRSTQTTTHEGAAWYYDLDIPGDDSETVVTEGCAAGEQVYFYIGSDLADQAVPWMSGVSRRLDLSRSLSRSLTWDRSTLSLTGQCLVDGRAEYTVTNGGQNMAGPTAWREYEADNLTQSGEFTLGAGAAQVWTFASNGVPVRFEADQRPGHPGSSAPNLTLTCPKPTAVGLRSFTASSAGNLGGCAAGNKLRGQPCTVTSYTPGYVSGKCAGGYWFSKVSTSRTFRLDQAVTVQGCIMAKLQLASATGLAAAHQQVTPIRAGVLCSGV